MISHGVKDSLSSYHCASFNIDSTSHKRNPERVNLVWLEAHADEKGIAWVDTICVLTTADLFLVEPPERRKYETPKFELKAARLKFSSNDDWDLKGFYGSFDPTKNAFAQLSPIWGGAIVDGPAPEAMPLFEPAAWSSVLYWPVAAIESLSANVLKSDRYRLSHPRGGLANTTGWIFNALDHIDDSLEISKASFYFHDVDDMSVLSGVVVDYTNQKQLQYDYCGAGMLVQTWVPSRGRMSVSSRFRRVLRIERASHSARWVCDSLSRRRRT